MTSSCRGRIVAAAEDAELCLSQVEREALISDTDRYLLTKNAKECRDVNPCFAWRSAVTAHPEAG